MQSEKIISSEYNPKAVKPANIMLIFADKETQSIIMFAAEHEITAQITGFIISFFRLISTFAYFINLFMLKVKLIISLKNKMKMYPLTANNGKSIYTSITQIPESIILYLIDAFCWSSPLRRPSVIISVYITGIRILSIFM